MSKKAVVITVISLGAVCAAAFGGIKAYQKYQSSNQKAEVHFVSELNMYYYENEMTSSGIVTNDSSQDVYALEDKTIAEVHVEEGQEVEISERSAVTGQYTYLVEPSIAMSGIYRTSERLHARRGIIQKIEKTDKGFYLLVETQG